MTTPSLLLLHGANLNLLGEREPEIYGTVTLSDLVRTARDAAESAGWSLVDVSTNSERELVEAVHSARGVHEAIVVNPGAFTHSSWALHDALAAYRGVVVELHLSNPDSREPWRRTSVVAPVATGTISGFGAAGYPLAIAAAVGATVGG